VAKKDGKPVSAAGRRTSRVQERMTRRTQGSPRQRSKADTGRRVDPELDRSTRQRRGNREMKDLGRAMRRDAAGRRTAARAAEAAGSRARQGLARAAGRAATAPAAVAAGVEAVRDYVEPRAERARESRREYNRRAGTSQSQSAREVRDRSSNSRLSELRSRGMKAGGKVRGCGMARGGSVRPCKMVKMKGS